MSNLQSKIDRITDILRRDDGISGAMHYTEQISWIIFLKYLSDYENEKNNQAKIDNKKYAYVIDEKYRWHNWAYPVNSKNEYDVKNAKSGDDLTEFVNKELFPYLQSFKNATQDVKSIKYKIGGIFEFINNRIASGHTLREVVEIISSLNFQSKDELFELSHIYENLLQGMGSDGGNSGEFYTPRCVIKAMVNTVKPQVGQTIYDGAVGSAGFLIEAYEYMKQQKGLSTKQLRFLSNDTFFGNEKTPLAYVMGVMNMILHGIESPNIYKFNTLTVDIRGIQEKDRYSIILANPPFGGKEKDTIYNLFPVKSNATELLFIQHFLKSLKQGGTAAIIIPEGVLFQSNNAFKQVKETMLKDFNVHTIVSLPSGVFLPYSAVKTNIIYFSREGATTDVWYYEVSTPNKLTKNKPIQYEHLEEFVNLYNKRSNTANSWTVPVQQIIDNNYDLSAKNPTKQIVEEHIAPAQLLQQIKSNDAAIQALIADVETIIEKGY
ncbi:MAG: class I SAM-dependent DNA methyltransferase [Ferruginibacter sp.]|nr:SAM-dependent DNA methyltransferase [Ferruginibacter sp.]